MVAGAACRLRRQSDLDASHADLFDRLLIQAANLERWVDSARRECLAWSIILGRLEHRWEPDHVLGVFNASLTGTMRL
jgi:hypothetical protein